MQAGGLGSWRESLCWRRGAGSQVWQALQHAVPQRAAAGRGELLPDQPELSKCSCCLYSRGESQNRQSLPQPGREGGLAGVAGSPGRGVFHPPGHLQPARTALSPSLCPSFCLVSLPCVFTRTLQCFSDALVCGSKSFPALPAGSSALACDVRFLSPLHSCFLGKAFCQGIPFTFLKLSTAVFCSLFLFSRSG